MALSVQTHEHIRHTLKRNTIRIVARDGLEHLTTKKIAKASGYAETYIYRYFNGKDDLVRQCFFKIDGEIGRIITEICEKYSLEFGSSADVEAVVRDIWFAYWNYLCRHPENTLFYFRFYMSVKFDDEVEAQRKRNHAAFISLVSKTLGGDEQQPDPVIWLPVTYVVETTMTCAVKYIRDKITRKKQLPFKENAELVYRLVARPVTMLAIQQIESNLKHE